MNSRQKRPSIQPDAGLRRGNGNQRRLHGQKGNSLVEYALVFMFFMALVFGIVDFGRALYTYHLLSTSAKQATRWAAVNGATCNNDGSCDGKGWMNNGPATATDIATFVQAHAPVGVDSSKIVVSSNVSNIWPDSGQPLPANCTDGAVGPVCECYSTSFGTYNSQGCPVQVTVSYPFSFLFPFVGGTITMSSSSELVIVH